MMEPETSAKVSFQRRLKEATDQIALFRDEIRLHLHLANMDAKSSIERLEPHFRRIQQQLEHAFQIVEQKEDETELKVHLALMDANTRVQALEEWFEARVDWLRRKQAQTQISWDTSKLQMHLAAMDAEDYLREKKSSLQKRFQRSRSDLHDDAEEIVQQLSHRVQKLRMKVSNPPDDSINLNL